MESYIVQELFHIHRCTILYSHWHTEHKWKSIVSFRTKIENDQYTLKESFMHILSLIASLRFILFAIKVCRWYARKTSYCYWVGRENQRYITSTYLRSKSTLNNINLCIINFKGRKQKIKATATFTAEWTLQNKSLIVYYTSITKSTLIDGLHYLYTI